MQPAKQASNALFLPVSDSEIPDISIATLFGNAYFGGMFKPSFVSAEKFVSLPSVYDSRFESAFKDAVRRFSIGTVFSQHPVVISTIIKLINQRKIDAQLVSIHPQHSVQLQEYSATKVVEKVNQLFSLTSKGDSYKLIALAAMLNGVIGYTPISKAWALHQLCLESEGDLVVEIGVMFGLSALSQAIACRAIGSTFIGIDTFENSEAIQVDSPEILGEVAGIWNRLSMQQIALNILRLSGATFHLLKDDSLGASKFVSSQFPQKRVSLLHIDGNHDYLKVKKDYEIWRNFLDPRHVLVIDDTSWSGGEGPGRLADELRSRSIYVRIIDFCGSTFFMTY